MDKENMEMFQKILDRLDKMDSRLGMVLILQHNFPYLTGSYPSSEQKD